MDVTYEYYKIFYYVAKYGSFSKAAVVLQRGQPNITKMINNLESQLSCKLLIRSNRGVTLTSEGEKLYAHVEIAMEHLLAAESELISGHSIHEGTVSIATTEVALYGCVLSALTHFTVDYPSVKIKLTNQTNAKALRSLQNGTVDFAIVTTSEIDEGNLKYTVIKDFREILCCKTGCQPDFSDADIKAIEYARYVSLDTNAYTYKLLSKYLFAQGIYKEPDISVATVDQVLPIVKSGIGIGFISEFIARDALTSGEISEIALKNPPPIRQICIVKDKKRAMNPVARRFAEYLMR